MEERTMRTLWRVGSLFLVVFFLARSLPQVGARQQQETLLQNDLKIIVLAYHLHCDETGKPPEKAEDLAPYLGVDKKDKRLLEVLQSGRIQFQYNVPIANIVKTGLTKTILAYEKDLPANGGYAAFADGTVKKLTAQEFKKTALAGRK
jgi:hypothetical protein